MRKSSLNVIAKRIEEERDKVAEEAQHFRNKMATADNDKDLEFFTHEFQIRDWGLRIYDAMQAGGPGMPANIPVAYEKFVDKFKK